ncbi:MAG: isopentenyl-diphosphate Delta-isomerase, partial [Candidatus Korarchaeota archaeon]|nr:isopentenyl-diphosphate Delta-isomerase [Candidatus Korarchaeota archaeon]NIU84893.1 isopentenyl-diphosphate Delta-isomerase [Candidatus Thorarchaeota archaeon]NIW14919.1 isopentenyl-diphosphate Delta-isomerase [Candidatus Thorarchaeota archaeon]NIW52953.1 isopentenyl-diphosphate Delta-isomerase [Candidatus Korarchaeota archaeon]
DEEGKRIGTAEKLKAHQGGGQLHEAFSIFIFNSDGELLLQKRVAGKYHSSGGLWSNTCCSHPQPSESLNHATHRKLKQELGFTCDLQKAFDFTYKEEVGDLTEWEYDHVFVGYCDPQPDPNPKEVADWKWIAADKVLEDVHSHPEEYTSWFKLLVEKVIDYVHSHGNAPE